MQNSFQVPEGYFESLTSEIMNKLPEKEKAASEPEASVTVWTKIKPLLYMAAMFVGAALIIRVGAYNGDKATNEVAVTEVDIETVTDEYIDAAMDRSMLDDYSLYVYLSDAATE